MRKPGAAFGLDQKAAAKTISAYRLGELNQANSAIDEALGVGSFGF